MNDSFDSTNMDLSQSKFEESNEFTKMPNTKRINMGAIFHSRITKAFALMLGIVLAALVGYSSMSYYLNRKPKKVAVITKSAAKQQDATQPEKNTKTEEKPTEQTAIPTTTPTATAPTASTPTSTTKVYCGVSGMPEGVCTAIASIEKDGLKGNPYVNKDTSQVPEGSTVQIDEASWKTTSASTGNLNFSAILGGQNYKGTGKLQIVDGTWKVIDYTLS